MKKRLFSLFLIGCLVLSLFSGCSSNSGARAEMTCKNEDETTRVTIADETAGTTDAGETAADPSTEENTTGPATEENTTEPTEEGSTTGPSTEETEEGRSAEETVLMGFQTDPVQMNSVHMLNYLTLLLSEIHASSNDRIFLDQVYFDLLNNTDPNSVDQATQSEYNVILDLLYRYKMIDENRERTLFLYERNLALTLREAVPNPINVMNILTAESKEEIILAALNLAVDSVSSYMNAAGEAEIEYLQEGWILDDEVSNELHNSRKSLFNYMIAVAHEYNLPKDMCLTAARVDSFIEIRSITNIALRLQRLKDSEADYQYFGDYWLLLTESYYLNGDYEEALEAYGRYLELDIGIFRMDQGLASTIPYAIVSARKVLSDEDYLAFATEQLALLEKNSDRKDWALRYYASQTYVELYALSGDAELLKEAYALILEATSPLIDDQNALNEQYLAQIVEVKSSKDATKEEKNTVKAYNAHLKEARKTALPPVYEPLRLCCDLLFSIAEELGISKAEQSRVDAMLHENGDALFLDVDLDNRFRFSTRGQSIPTDSVTVEFDGKTFSIPAKYVSEVSRITMLVNGKEITSWTPSKVDRAKSNSVDLFTAEFTSPETGDIDYIDGSVVTFWIHAYEGSSDPLVFKFQVEKTVVLYVPVSTTFTRI